MKKFLRKSNTDQKGPYFSAKQKNVFAICVCSAVITICLFSFSINILKRPIVNALNKELQHQISIGWLSYLPPRTFMAHDVRLRGDHVNITVNDVQASFSLSRLLKKKQLKFIKVAINKTDADNKSLMRFFCKNYQAIMDYIKNSPKGNIKIIFHNMFLTGNLLDGTQATKQCHLNLSIDNGQLRVKGRAEPLNQQKQKSKTLPAYHFNLDGQWTDDSFDIQEIAIKNDNFILQLWGKNKGPELSLNGFAASKTKQTNFVAIDSFLYLDFPKIDIKNIDLNIAQNPINIQGGFTFDETVQFQLSANFTPSAKNKLKLGQLQKGLFNLSGHMTDQQITFDSNARFQFPDKPDKKAPSQFFNLKLNNVFVNTSALPGINIAVEQIAAKWTDKRERQLHLSKVQLDHRIGEQRQKRIHLKAQVYEGHLNGAIDTVAVWPCYFQSTLNFQQLNMQQLTEITDVFQPVHGKADGFFSFTNKPNLSLAGQLTMAQPRFIQHPLLMWLKKSFQLTTLDDTTFDKLTTHFMISHQQTGISNFAARNNDIQIAGDYLIDGQNLLNSQATILLSRPILAQSKSLKRILELIDATQPYIDFKFQLSGERQKANFYWAPSETKNTIQSALPDFMERMLENQMDHQMQQPVTHKP